ncbi:Ig-like domain-containing protein [Fibrobacterota bacterium]
MKRILIALIISAWFFAACDNDSDPVSANSGIRVSGTVIPSDAYIMFIMGQDTTDINADDDGFFHVSVPAGRGRFVITADGYREYTTSPTYTEPGSYDLGTIELNDVPSLISNIYKNTSYSQNSHLFYIRFSEEMDPSSKSAVSISPDFDGDLVWANNNTDLYFYPTPAFMDTSAFTITISTDAVSLEQDALAFKYERTFEPNEARIVRSYPNANSINFSTSREAYIEFTVNMSDSNADSAIRIAPDVPMEMRLENKFIYLLPQSGSWPPSTACTLSLVDTLYSLKGTPISPENYSWNFTTTSGSADDYPFPLSYINKNSNYSQSSYLFYLTFSEEMEVTSKLAVSTVPEIDGSLVWKTNNTQLYFYPVPAFMDTAALTIRIDTTAMTSEGEQIEFSFEKTFTANEARIVRSYPNSNSFDFSTGREAYIECSASMSDSNLTGAFEVSPDMSLDIWVEGNYIYFFPKSESWPSGTSIAITQVDTLFSTTGVPVYVDNYAWNFTTTSGSGSQGDVPYPVSSIYKTSSHSPNSYLFYINFSVEMDTSSKQSVSTDPPIDGSLVWSNNNTSLYFYPVPTFMDTAEVTIIIDTTAFSIEQDTVSFVYQKTFLPNEPRITTSYPASNTIDFSTTREAYLQFSVNMSDSNVENAIQVSPEIPLDIRVANNYIYLLPSSGAWPPGTTITLSLVDNLYSILGEPIFVPNYAWNFTTYSGGSGSEMVQITPDSGATDFGLSDNLYVRTVNTDIYTINQIKSGFTVRDNIGNAVSGTYNMGSTYFYFYPENLKMAQWYQVYVILYDSAAADYDTLAHSSFRTEPFSPSSIYPSNNAVLRRSTDAFQFTFNSEVEKLSVVSSLTIAPATEIDYTVTNSNSTISLLPVSGAWEAEKEYALAVNTNTLIDINGNAVENIDTLYRFAAPEVKIIDHSPMHNVVNVDTSAVVTLTFNTMMDTASASAAFSIADSAGAGFAGTIGWSPDFTELTFSQPASTPFARGMVYNVRVDTTAVDAYGINLKAPFAVTFTVE